jgi:ubiquinone/menaquinone biosynthesis C-methylase UbiE
MIQDKLNEKQAASAFSKQALVFDAYDAGNTIIHYKRERVREHVLRHLRPGGSILELNAGTGEDALYFASRGHRVHATDIAAGMQDKLREKIRTQEMTHRISTEICSFTALDTLKNKGPYDLIFSNFAGLNCTRELGKVLRSFDPLLKPGGQVTLVILPPFSLWECLLVFRGRFKTAFRRFFSRRKGAPAQVEGIPFRCWYYPPSFVTRTLKKEKLELLGLEGLCTIVPPSYIEHFAQRHPRLYNFLCALENKWKAKWPWRAIGDYYIISFVKAPTSLSRR